MATTLVLRHIVLWLSWYIFPSMQKESLFVSHAIVPIIYNAKHVSSCLRLNHSADLLTPHTVNGKPTSALSFSVVWANTWALPSIVPAMIVPGPLTSLSSLSASSNAASLLLSCLRRLTNSLCCRLHARDCCSSWPWWVRMSLFRASTWAAAAMKLMYTTLTRSWGEGEKYLHNSTLQ